MGGNIKTDILLFGDVYTGLNYLDDNSISVVITSPPYWKQRDYGFEDQVGQEETPEEYIGRLVKIFAKLYQKLKNDGVFFLNIGDKYLNRYGKSHLLQIPYRLAYHLVKNGWHLKDIIIWYKPNHLPAPVKDRFTNTYEPILVLTKNANSIYCDDKQSKVIEIPLQQTPYKHTAVYPESLVEELLKRVELKNGDLILDPFAGTGTTAVVVNKLRNHIFGTEVYSILIEKGKEFIEIIKTRTKIEKIIEVGSEHYEYCPVEEDTLPEDITPNPILKDRNGEVYIAQSSEEFLSILKGITTNEFKKFHREDAPYFLGVKKWDLNSLYYVHTIYKYGYVLRNMLVISDGNIWYPIFMLVRNSTKIAYKFYLDRIRIKPKTDEKRDWGREEFIGEKVKDTTEKKPIEGYILEVLERYIDGFPKIVAVQWNKKLTLEFVIHPQNDEILMESLKFLCPRCRFELTEPYDPIGNNFCISCGQELWTDLDTIPLIEEPEEVLSAFKSLETNGYFVSKELNNKEFKTNKVQTNSKFSALERINWGASPGARKIMLGEYFTKVRLYKIDQPIVAQYLTLLRKLKGMSIREIVDKFPLSYQHTVGHWFRKDFGGSIPLPEDIERLKEIFNVQDGLLKILQRTALKFQTVKVSAKGKNPGDYIRCKGEKDLIEFLRLLYVPSKYIITKPCPL